jgi:hypothetical protein
VLRRFLGRRGGGAVEVDVEEVLGVGLGWVAGDGSGGSGDGVLARVLLLFLDGGFLDGVGAVAALADEGFGGLVVDGGERGELGEEAVEEGGGQGCDGGGDGGLVGEDDVLRDLRVAGEEAPVDVGAVADVGVVVFGGGGLEDLLDEALGLGLVGFFEEEFDDCGEDLELCLRGFSAAS